MVTTLEAHVAVLAQYDVARVTVEVGAQLGEVFPEHVASQDVLLVVFVGFYVR